DVSTTSLAECQRGRSRRVAVDHQRAASAMTSSGPAPRATAWCQYSPRARPPARQDSAADSIMRARTSAGGASAREGRSLVGILFLWQVWCAIHRRSDEQGSPRMTDLEGRFIVIASAHALAASPFKAGYVSAKHGVLGLVKTLALEGAADGILATAVCPGFVRTPLVEGQIASQAEAHGLREDRVLEDVILAPHAV